jgi:transposase InsO family protein
MDDIIIHSSTWEHHIETIDKVLCRLRDAGLTVHIKKSQFACHELVYLGHLVTREGIRPEQKKVEAVRSFERPTTLSQMQTFLGFCGVFRRFIPGYGEIVRSLHDMTRKSEQRKWAKNELWNPERERAFDAIKAVICDAVTLAHPRADRPLLMVCDASDTGMGAMLAQVDDNGSERPIAFASATFTGAALNYTTTEKEGMAVIWAASQFRPYVYGTPTVVVTDHSALTTILRKGTAPQRIARMVLDLTQYDFTYVHRKGSHNKVADALSRLTSVMANAHVVTGHPDDFTPPSSVNAVNETRANDKAAQSTVLDDIVMPSAQVQATPSETTPLSGVGDCRRVDNPTDANAPTTTPSTVELSTQPTTVIGGQRVNRKLKRAVTTPTYVTTNDGTYANDVNSDDIRKAQHLDRECHAMFVYLTTNKLPDDPTLQRWIRDRHDQFAVLHDLVYHVDIVRRNGSATAVHTSVWVPASLRENVLRRCHDHPATGGHVGFHRTVLRIRQYYWWPRLYADVAEYVMACIQCQATRARTTPPAMLQAHLTPTSPFETVAMDLLAMPTTSRGNKYVLVIIDHFSRYVIAIPIADKNATTIANALMERLVLIHGHPSRLLSDRGGEFMNACIRKLCERLGTKKSFTTPYRPQADGMVERFNRTLLRMLRIYVDTRQSDWDVLLPFMLYAYNTAVARTTGEAPYTIIFGREPPAPAYYDALAESGVTATADNVTTWVRMLKEHLANELVEAIRTQSDEAKAIELARRNRALSKPPEYAPGTVVWLADRRPLKESNAKPKLQRKQQGLFVVVTSPSPVTCQIRRLGNIDGRTRKVHVDLLMPFHSPRGERVILSPPNDETDVDDANDDTASEEAYEVERIIAMKWDTQARTLSFLVVWKGYPNSDSWQLEHELNCPDKIDLFILTAEQRWTPSS